MSSAFVVSRIKKITGAKKVGHTGTLDPFARGLLICGINQGTRISRFFLGGDKCYRAGLTFGMETDTLDSTGAVINTCDHEFFQSRPDFFSPETIESLLKAFTGPQEQFPPVYSALKHQGVPLYKLARKGTPVQKDARSIVIRAISLLEIQSPSIVFDVSCSSGTYIRSLAADIGKAVGCGAHLSALCRTESCGFYLSQAISLDELSQLDDVSEKIISMNDALPHLPVFNADEHLKRKIMNGVQLSVADLGDPDIFQSDFIKICDVDQRVIAIIAYDKNLETYNYCCVFHD
jgi:tRNA pseudouridine55 synthase